MTDSAGISRATPPLAVVGLACRFPDADDPAALLDVVLTGRRAFRRLPPGRIELAEYYQPDLATCDATYSTRAALIEGWQFDRRAFGIDQSVYVAADPAHWLALETAARALSAAGLTASTGLNRDRTGVIIGNTLAGDTSRANALRVRWPYVRRVLADALSGAGIPASQAEPVLRQAASGYLAPFPPMGALSLAGSMPGTIATAISSHFGFRGGSHAVDSACSSSLQAIASGCAALVTGDLDAVIAGGVDLSLDPLELIGLAKAGLLATGDVRVYDEHPTGYLPGEGCGVVVLMRAADARAANLPVYAEILGWGVSSGARPGETQSHASSQLLAMKRAYERSAVDPADIHFIEGNGASSPLADEAELMALNSIRAGAKHPVALGSVKANIGHAKAAAGAAGLIKAVVALSTGVVPPTTGTQSPHQLITEGDGNLILPRASQDCEPGTRFAAVCATGIGGSNVHVVLRHEPPGRARQDRRQRSAPLLAKATAKRSDGAAQPQLAAAPAATPFLLHAPDRSALSALLSRIADIGGWLSDAEMQDLACMLSRDEDQQGPVRVAIVAVRQEQLAMLAREAVTMLPYLSDGLMAVRPGIYASDNADGRMTLLLSAHSAGASQHEPPPEALSPAVTRSLATLRWLDSLGVHANAAVGHGVGALAGLAWAGALGESEVLEIAHLRAQFLRKSAEGQSTATGAGAESNVSATVDSTGLSAAIAERFRFGPPRRRLISTLTGSEIGSVADAIDLICQGFAGADRVADAIKVGAVGANLLLETGPGHALVTAAADVTKKPAISLNSGLADPASIARAAAALFAAGALGEPKPLFAGRQARPLDIWREHVFLTSPCAAVPGQRLTPDTAFGETAVPSAIRTESTIAPDGGPAPDGRPAPDSAATGGGAPAVEVSAAAAPGNNALADGSPAAAAVDAASAECDQADDVMTPDDSAGDAVAVTAFANGSPADAAVGSAPASGANAEASATESAIAANSAADKALASDTAPAEVSDAAAGTGETAFAAAAAVARVLAAEYAPTSGAAPDLATAGDPVADDGISGRRDEFERQLPAHPLIAAAAQQESSAETPARQEPAPSEPGPQEPAAEPATAQAAAKAATAEPAAADPAPAKPAAAKPAAAKPTAAEPAAAEPAAAKPARHEPVRREAAPDEPAPAEQADSPVLAAVRAAIGRNGSRQTPAPGDRDVTVAEIAVPASREITSAARLGSWTRCFATGLRPVRRALTHSAAPRPWRTYAAARSPILTDLSSSFAADASAGRTLAVVEDPSDERSCAAAIGAAQDAITTGELLVLTTGGGFTGFFASLHAEHPSIGITILRVQGEAVSPDSLMQLASAERGVFRELVLGPEGTVWEPVLTDVELTGSSDIALGPEDVIMITRATNGAGLALAQVVACCGAGVAVIGRAGEHDDTELVAGYEDLRAAGARVGYEIIDIDDPASVAGAIERIEDRLGPVTAIAHAAGMDYPAVVHEIAEAEATAHVGDEAAILELLASSVRAEQLRLIISVGTVASRYGLAGASLHALSSAALASRAANLAADGVGCQVLHLDLAAWSAAGLGSRPELAEELASAGTDVLDFGPTCRLLLKIMSTPGVPRNLAIHGRVGGLPASPAPVITRAELSAAGLAGGGAFLREVNVNYPGAELVCSARLSLASDPYLADYRIDGMAVLPPVLALEALAQAASVLAGQPLRRLTKVTLESPVLIPTRREAALQVCAMREGDAIVAALRCADSSYLVDHAKAEFSCAGQPEKMPAAAAVADPSSLQQPGTRSPGLVDGAELYGPICFQSGRFRRIALLPEVTASSGRALARGADEQAWFALDSPLASTSFLLGSPALNDAALQVLQACAPHRRVRPASCESVQFAGRSAVGPVEIRAIAESARALPAEALVPSQAAAPASEMAQVPMVAAETEILAVADLQPPARKSRRGKRRQHPAGGAGDAAGTDAAADAVTANEAVAADRLAAADSPIGDDGPTADGGPTADDGLATDDSPAAVDSPAAANGAAGAAQRALIMPPAEPGKVTAGERARVPVAQLWNVEAVDADGQLLAAWRGIRLRDSGPLPRNAAWPPTLLSVFLERRAADLGLDDGLQVTVSCGHPDGPLPELLSTAPQSGASGDAASLAEGRHAGPERRTMNTGTAAGTGALAGFSLRLRAPVPVACGWVAVELAHSRHEPAAGMAAAYAQLRAEVNEAPSILAARLAAVGAALQMAGLEADRASGRQLIVNRTTNDGWVVFTLDRSLIACAVVELSGVSAPVAIAMLTRQYAHTRSAARDGARLAVR